MRYNTKCNNPPIHYIVFATPQKKKYLLLKDSDRKAVFFVLGEKWEIWQYDDEKLNKFEQKSQVC